MIRKTFIFFLLALWGQWTNAQTPKPAAVEGKVLVAFFSRTGNTREIAAMIHDDIGGDLFEIQTVVPYPSDYEAVKAQAMREQESNFRPALKAKIMNFDAYRIIYLGYPIWWAKVPPPIASFLSAYSFSGKTIVPFCTHQGSHFGQTLSDIRKLCPQANLADGLAVWGRDAGNANHEVSQWLQAVRAGKPLSRMNLDRSLQSQHKEP
jgi:flavodoxin